MDSAVFDELLISALDKPSKKTLDRLLEQLATAGNPIPADVIEQLDELWEAWGNDELDDAQGAFCVGLAALPMTDSPVFRKMLIAGVKAMLPPYMTRSPIMKAIGVRDEKLSLAEISSRLHRLIVLKNGLIIFLPNSMRWGTVGALDNINASLSVTPFGLYGGNIAIPLDSVLKDAVILSSGPELQRLVNTNHPISSSEFRAIAKRKALTPVTESQLQIMAQSGCGSKFDPAEFERYWKTESNVSTPSSTTRRACDGRSLKEVDMLLDQEGDDKLSDEEVSHFYKFYANLKPDTIQREAKQLAMIIAKVAPRATVQQLKDMLTPLVGKTPFWPKQPAQVPLVQFSVWGNVPAKNLESLALASSALFSEEYLANCAMRIPQKALNAVCPLISEETLYDYASMYKVCSADFLLWVWKNRKKRPSEELTQLLNVENITRTLANDDVPKEWSAALRELRGLLLDNADFQKQLIAAADGNAMMFASVLQGALFLSSGERQSLMVKLARVSPELRDYLENGAGQRILQAGKNAAERAASATPADQEPNYTSIKSHKRLMEELDNIINVQVPENREALKTARAHGDFRENSEFDAAKERRNFLTRRRNELERELGRIQPISMRTVRVENIAVVGSEIELENEKGQKEVYQLLGAWDGDPARKFLAYRTRLGKAVLNQPVGAEFNDGDHKYKLIAVRPLSPEIIAELDA